jgi:hypothetical protein
MSDKTEEDKECKHEADPGSYSLFYEDKDVILDLHCKHCGQGGSLLLIVDPEDINW